MARAFFILSLALTLALVSFGAGMYSFQEANFAFRLVRSVKTQVEQVINPAGSTGIFRGVTAEHLQPSRGQGDGVMVNTRPDDGALVLLAGFFDGENQARLVRRDGSVVTSWSLDYFEHFPDPATRPCALDTPLRVDTHGIHLTPGGDLVVNYEYCGTVKLDRCEKVLWTLEHPTHHSIDPSERGGYWILGRRAAAPADQPRDFLPFTGLPAQDNIADDLILRVSETGEIVEQHSLMQILYDSGLEAVVTANGDKFTLETAHRHDVLHANKIAELPAALAGAFPGLGAGDLAVSLRNRNLVVVLDAETKRVVWHRVGPWLRQHDPEFRPDGKISIFNNNVYLTAYDDDGFTRLDVPRVTNIVAVDPTSGAAEVVYGERPGQELLSVVRGQHELLDGGEILITEFDAGRVLQVDAAGGTVWEYVNRFDDAHVGEISNSQLFMPGYFGAEMGRCG